VSRIERWTRFLLEGEARKRGLAEPETRSRPDLLRAIVQHEYKAGNGLRDNARRLVSSLIESAASAALPLLTSVTKPNPPPAATRPPEREPSTTQIRTRDTAQVYPAQDTHPYAASAGATSHIVLQRNRGELRLMWQITDFATEQARRLLGHPGELALRVVSVRPDATLVVGSEISEHGPVTASGAWTLVLPSVDAHCVGSVGLRHGERFVSIVHSSSRAPQTQTG
jgi:hypothetical protein